jgi:transcriptional regulator with XRE-family HTH domain
LSNNIQLIKNINLDEFKNNLKFAREDKGITIEQASKILNIHINVLENIENGEFDKLSNDVFTMGHIKTYLNWLGIDPKLITTELKKSNNINLNKKKYKVILPNNLKISKFYISLISLVSFFLIIIIYKNINTIESKTYITIDTKKIKDEVLIDKIETKDKIKTAEFDKKSEAINAPDSLLDKEIEIEDISLNLKEKSISFIYIKAISESWVEIQRYNTEIFVSKVLKKGEELKLPYEKDLILVTGNAGGIIIHINDKIINNIGLVGEVKRNISLNYDDLIKFLSE